MAVIVTAIAVISGYSNAQTQSPTADAEAELRRALERGTGGDAKLVESLDAFLKQYPDYRRNDIERELFKLSLRMGNRDRAIAAAEHLVAANERDLETLTQLIGLLRVRHANDDLKRAMRYADQLVERVEATLSAGKPGRLSAAQWNDRKERSRATVRLLRGQVLADLGENEKASAELKRSFKAAKLAATAVALGELAEKQQSRDEALDYFVQAMAISFTSEDKIDEKAIRTKLTQLYTAKSGSEAGLGDRLLKAYDQLVREQAERDAALELPNINAGVTDPLMFKLTKVEGGTVRLADFRGKVVVANFWATWCGPCRVEMPLLERTMATYKNDKSVAFLAISTDEDRPQVKPYLDTQKVKLPVVYADYLDEHYAVSSIPTTIVFDRQGNISFRQAGFNSREDFVAMLTDKIEAAKKQ